MNTKLVISFLVIRRHLAQARCKALRKQRDLQREQERQRRLVQLQELERQRKLVQQRELERQREMERLKKLKQQKEQQQKEKVIIYLQAG